VLDIGRDITAWEIDELQSAKHNPQATSRRGSVFALCRTTKRKRAPILVTGIHQKATPRAPAANRVG
jgi:hypothetical protein